MSHTQQLTASEIESGGLGRFAGVRNVQYVSDLPPYETYRWDGDKLVSEGGSLRISLETFSAFPVGRRAALQGATLIDPSTGSVLGVVDGGGVLNQFSRYLLQSAVPMVLPSSGSFGNNGALTLTTALGYTLAGCFMYFPANAIQAGSAAGWYWTVMSSTSAAAVFNDRYTTGNPVVPLSPTPFVSTGPGAYTQTTAVDIQSMNVVVPGLAMGINGMLRIHGLRTQINNANNKLNRTRLGGITSQAANQTTSNGNRFDSVWMNAGVYNRQRTISDNPGDLTSANLSGGFPADRTVDTSVNQTLDVTLLLNVATDWVCLERLVVELVPAG